MSSLATLRRGSTCSAPVFAAWRLTALISPRPSARVAVQDITGELLNEYAGSRRLTLDPPLAPWAMYLAGTDHRYRFLAFDLDAKGGRTAADADRDSRTLAGLLRSAGLSPVVCESGPSGGRHVWVGLAESVPAPTVATLARLLQRSLPSLDIAPLTNPATGCVRPPGAPHRHGGSSRVLSGLLDALTHPTATASQVTSLVERLAADAAPSQPMRAHPAGPLPVDDHGRLYLPGTKRSLPAASAAALEEDASSGDASAVLWRVLIGAAAAHWRYADIASLAASAPGLEHVRTSRERSRRVPRGGSEATAVLRRQWDKAVRWVATAPKQIGEDPTFDARADALACHVRTIQERADASVGRWVRGCGPRDRRVLDILCLLSLQAMRTEVEADIRRLGMLAGISHESARRALISLATHGWIVRTRGCEGPRGAVWSIDPQGVLHSENTLGLPQADPRPLGAGAAERNTLLALLEDRAQACAHDVFTCGGGLGLLAGNVYARLDEQGGRSSAWLARQLGLDQGKTVRLLHELRTEGLAMRVDQGWRRSPLARREAVATVRGIAGRLKAREASYRLQRAVWAWWLAERDWMRAPRRSEVSHGRPATPLPRTARGLSTRGRYPRHRSGRGNHRLAAVILAAGTTSIGAPTVRRSPGTRHSSAA